MLIIKKMCWTGGGNHANAIGFKVSQKVWLPADAALSKSMCERKGRSKRFIGL